MADVIARTILDFQAHAEPGAIAVELNADIHTVVHQAAGMVSVQLDISVGDALARLPRLRVRRRYVDHRGRTRCRLSGTRFQLVGGAMNQTGVLKCEEKKYVARLPRPRTADEPEFWECP